MRKIFYKTVNNTYEDGSFNGLITVVCFIIENNDLKIFFEIETTDMSPYTIEEEIQNYLDDNGYGDEYFEFTKI